MRRLKGWLKRTFIPEGSYIESWWERRLVFLVVMDSHDGGPWAATADEKWLRYVLPDVPLLTPRKGGGFNWQHFGFIVVGLFLFTTAMLMAPFLTLGLTKALMIAGALAILSLAPANVWASRASAKPMAVVFRKNLPVYPHSFDPDNTNTLWSRDLQVGDMASPLFVRSLVEQGGFSALNKPHQEPVFSKLTLGIFAGVAIALVVVAVLLAVTLQGGGPDSSPAVQPTPAPGGVPTPIVIQDGTPVAAPTVEPLPLPTAAPLEFGPTPIVIEEGTEP